MIVAELHDNAKPLYVGWHTGVAVKEQSLLDKSSMGLNYNAVAYRRCARPPSNKLFGEIPK